MVVVVSVVVAREGEEERAHTVWEHNNTLITLLCVLRMHLLVCKTCGSLQVFSQPFSSDIVPSSALQLVCLYHHHTQDLWLQV